MVDDAFGKRIGDVLRADRSRGRLGPLSSYQRRFPGFEAVVAREYEQVCGGREGGLRVGGGTRGDRAYGPGGGDDGGAGRTRDDPAVDRTVDPDAAAPAAPAVVVPIDGRPGRYTELGEVARGGMGAILRVRDETLERDLAMKVVLGEAGRIAPGAPEPHGPLARRFLEEARITARLDHPGVVPVHELGTDAGGRLFFTMKLIKGGKTLEEVFRRSREGDPEFTPARVVQILVRVLETLAFAHDRGVLHRDLKPANVMVGDFGEVYVMDWGLAKVVGESDDELRPAETGPEPGTSGAAAGLTEAGQILGTPAYMPIEQARNETLDARADVYAVGAMLYEFLAGAHPFGERGRTRTTVEVYRALVEGPPQPLARAASDAPAELVSIVEKAMARDRADRYATAMEFAQDLRSFVEGRVVRAHETGAWAELRKWVRRNRALAGAIAAAVLLLVVGLAAAVTLGLKADRERDAARRSAYRAGIGAAIADLANRDLYAARLRLDQTPEDLRGWEWRHLVGRLDESLHVFEGTGMALCPGGVLRAIDRAGVVREHDLARGTSRVLSTFPREGAEAWVSSDGGTVCAVRERPGERDGYDVWFAPAEGGGPTPPIPLRIWDRKWDRGFRMPRFVYSGLDQRLHLMDPRTGAERTPAAFDEGPEVRLMAVTSSAGASDGRFLLLERQHEALVFDLDTERTLLATAYPRYARPSSMAVAPDLSRVAFLGEDGAVEVRYAATGERTSFGRVQAYAREGFVEFDPTGRVLATGGRDRSVRLFDAADGTLLRTFQGHVKRISEGAFSSDGEYLVTRDAGDEIRVWAARGADPTVLQGHASYVYTIDFSPDGSRVYSGGWDGFVGEGGALRVWDTATGSPVAALGTAEEARCTFTLALTPDGRRIVTVGGAPPEFRGGPLLVWDADTGRVATECRGSYRTLGLHPDGRRAVAMQFGESMESEGDACHVVDLGTGEVLAAFIPKPVSWEAFSVNPACSPDGRLIATPSADASAVILWDAATYREVRRVPLPGAKVASIGFSPDGSRLLVTADDESWSVFDTATAERVAVKAGTGNEVLAGVYAPDGRWILTGGRDKTMRVWDARSFEEIARLPGHADYIKGVAASPNGEVFASASGDRTVRIWQTRTAAEIHVAQNARRTLVAELSPHVTALFEELGDATRVAARLRSEHTGRALEVALQLALAESVARSAPASAPK